MNAYGYVRVSSADQAENGVSLDAQRARITAWCAANEYQLVECFEDAGIRAKRTNNRPGLQRALERVCKSRGSALIVYSLSRLARSTKDAISIAEQLNKGGADLVSLSERLDTTSASGKMVFRMLAVLAEFESDLVSERTRTAMDHKRSNGQRIGTVPFGFDLAPNGKTLIPNESEQAVIEDIRRMRRRGKKLKQIAEALTERRIPTKTGRSDRWAHQVISRILRR